MHKKFHNKIEKIFTEYHPKSDYTEKLIKRGFVYSEFEEKKLLFVGINPSYLADSRMGSHTYCVQAAVSRYKRHYQKLQELVNHTVYVNNWTYIDLFFFRETNQNMIEEIINSDIEFIISQLILTNEIINEINPEIIVVCNSGAANFFGVNNRDNKNNIWLGYDFKFDENYGVEILTGIHIKTVLEEKKLLPNLFGKPFLFSSTLTYLDQHSKKRLNWIIKRVGENIKNLQT